MILKLWLNEWLNKYMKPSIKLKTFIKYDYIINKHIIPILGEYDIDELTPSILQEFFYNKIEKGNLTTSKSLSINTVLGIYSILKIATTDAIRIGITVNNSIRKVKLPSKKEKEIEVFNLDEQKKIVNYCLKSNKNNYLGILICLFTGIRLGELLALEWSDIDFINYTLKISKTAFTITKYGKDLAYINSPKTNTSKRIIPIPMELLFFLGAILYASAHHTAGSATLIQGIEGVLSKYFVFSVSISSRVVKYISVFERIACCMACFNI